MPKYLFASCLFEHQHLPKKETPQNDDFSHVAKHRFITKTFVATLLTKNVLFNLSFLKLKTFMLNKKHNLESGNKNKDKKKGFER